MFDVLSKKYVGGLSPRRRKMMFSKKTIIVLVIFLLAITFSLFVGYKAGATNSNIDTGEINPIISALLTKRVDLPITDINLTRVEYWDFSYYPFDLETNILDHASVQFAGTYLPTEKHFLLRHNIAIYKPGSAPSVTFSMKNYNDSIARGGNVKIIDLPEMDNDSWGFCYIESNTCFVDSRYNDLLSSISVVMNEASEEQIYEILELALTAFYKRAEELSIKSNLPIPPSTLTALALNTITPSPTPSQVYELMTSPDGTKKVQTRDWESLEIIQSDGKLLWIYTYDNKFEVSEPGISPFYWSKDGQYLYLTCYHGPDDSSIKYFGNHFKDGDCLFRFDINTGETKEIIPDQHPGYYAFSISPNEKYIVYANQNDPIVKIKLLDLNTNEEKTLFTSEDESIFEIGSFGWSPDMSKLLFSTSNKEGKDSILLLDLITLEVQPIITDISKYFVFDSWGEDGKVYYKDSAQFGDTWVLDLEKKIFIP